MFMAVGFVAWAAAQVDEVLRQVFCGLEESKYAAVTAGGQNTAWLLQACQGLAKCRDDLSADHRAELINLMKTIKDRMDQRNSYIHSMWWFQEPGESAYFAQSRRHKYFETPHWATPEKVIETGLALMNVCKRVSVWMDRAGIKGEALAGAMKLEAFWNQPSDDDCD